MDIQVLNLSVLLKPRPYHVTFDHKQTMHGSDGKVAEAGTICLSQPEHTHVTQTSLELPTLSCATTQQTLYGALTSILPYIHPSRPSSHVVRE